MAPELIRSRNHILDVYTGTQLLRVKSFDLLSGSNSIGPLMFSVPNSPKKRSANPPSYNAVVNFKIQSSVSSC